MKDPEAHVARLKELCDQAQALRDSAEALCKELTEQMAVSRAGNRSLQPANRRKRPRAKQR